MLDPRIDSELEVLSFEVVGQLSVGTVCTAEEAVLLPPKAVNGDGSAEIPNVALVEEPPNNEPAFVLIVVESDSAELLWLAPNATGVGPDEIPGACWVLGARAKRLGPVVEELPNVALPDPPKIEFNADSLK